MQKKYGKDGLVILTVALDPPSDKGLVADANAEIAKHPTLPNNVLWNGPDGEWAKKLNSTIMPTIYIFNRENRWVKKFPELDKEGDPVDPKDEDIDKAVEGLLKKK
jgi:hypothetical protein